MIKAASRLLTLLLLLLAAAACSAIDPNATFEAAPVASGTLSGTVSYRARVSLPAGAQVQVALIDASEEPFLVLAEQTVVTQGAQPPIAFALNYDAGAMEAERVYGLTARIIVNGEVTFSLPGYARVLTQGAPRDNVELLLQQGEATMTPSQPGTLRGTVTYLARRALPAESLIVVELIDQSATPLAILAEQRIHTTGEQVPVPYVLNFDPALIDESRSYGVAARIVVENKVGYYAERPTPVLTGDAPSDNVEILLRPASAEDENQPLSGVIEGRLIYLQRIALPADATVELTLAYADGGEMVEVARKVFATAGQQPPIPFTLDYSPEGVDRTRAYELSARILAGDTPLFAMTESLPVLTLGAEATGFDLILPIVSAAEVAPVTPTATPIPPTPLPATATLSGRLLIRERIALPAGVVIEAELLDLNGDPAAPISEYVVTTTGEQSPFPFVLRYDPAAIDPNGRYAVDARLLINGAPRWVAAALTPVLTAGAATTDLSIVLVAEEEPVVAPPVVATVAPVESAPAPEATALPDQPVTDAPASAAPAATATPLAVEEPTAVPPAGNLPVRVRGSADSLPPGAEVSVQLRSAAGAVLSTQTRTVDAAGEGLDFALAFDVAQIDPAESYVVAVRVAVDGETTFATGRGFPVLTGGSPASVEVTLD